jgi:hypothetical protein
VTRRCRALATLVAGVLAIALAEPPADAKILKTRRPGEHGPLALVLGSGFEYETDPEESEYGFPFLVEYGFMKYSKVSVEPSVVLVRSKPGSASRSVSGAGDLETTLTLELPTERRYRPGLSFEYTVKWPTAKAPVLGTGETDHSLGMILSKEFVPFDLDAEALYTWTGSPPGVQLDNTLELSLAMEWRLTHTFDFEGEAVTALGTGGRFHATGTLGGFANIGGPEQGQNESEFTAGLAAHLTDFLKLEQGLVFKSDGSFQFVFAWEYDFEGR